MNKILASSASPNASGLHQAAWEECLTAIDRLREQTRRDQVEIDLSRARTQVILDDLARLLNLSPQKAV